MTFYKGLTELLDIAMVSTGVFVLIVIYTRIVGLRSFAKMTSVDFATTIAVGSMIAAVILPSKPSIVGGCFGIAMVYVLQYVSSFLKARSKTFVSVVENSPRILMTKGKVDYEMLKKTNMSKGDLIGKLREANVLDLKKVKSVVFESTGDVSVLHGEGEVDPFILSDL